MSATFRLDRGRTMLRNTSGQRFDPPTRQWRAADMASRLEAFEAVGAVAAVKWLQRESGYPLRVPVGVVGPREASDAQLAVALEVGELLGECRLTVICGGRQGVMQAVCEGVARAGGLSIGLLPETDPAAANSYLGVAIATGIGEARNAVIARASFCLVAIGDSFGTLSEVAFGRQFGKLVIGLEGAAGVKGVQHVGSAIEAVEVVAEAVLAPA